MGVSRLPASSGFNVAASIKMRKYEGYNHTDHTDHWLQCGRIYKDAEIKCLCRHGEGETRLQCGRIYKDAEIRFPPAFCGCREPRFNVAASIKMRKSSPWRSLRALRALLQCGRIYKDAEIYLREPLDSATDRRSFNVAASIKMRKFNL